MNEHQRHVKARESILKGETPEKRIIVSFEDPKEKKEREKQIKEERERSNERVEALKEVKNGPTNPFADSEIAKR